MSKSYTIDDEMSKVIGSLEAVKPSTDEYAKTVKNLEVLSKVKAVKAPNRVSADTIVMGLVNILGIVLILQHENLNVISSKALSFVMKR